jgi:hypothetical protein
MATGDFKTSSMKFSRFQEIGQAAPLASCGRRSFTQIQLHRGPGPSGSRRDDYHVGLFHLRSFLKTLRSWEFVMHAASLNMGASHGRHGHGARRQRTVADARRRLDRLARLLDSALRVPGTQIRFGADSALNLIPGAGTVVAQGLSAYLIWEAHRLGVPGSTMVRMIGNLAIDSAISAVPVVGWVGDVFFKANLKNMALLREHLDREGEVLDLQPDAAPRA